MDWFVKRFLQEALVWLGLGVTLGVVMAVHPQWIIYRPAQLALMVLGFLFAPHVGTRIIPVLGTGAVLSALGAFAFILNIWRTMNGPEALRRTEQAPASRRPSIL